MSLRIMRDAMRRFVLAQLLLVVNFAWANPSFLVFDGTMYDRKPVLAQYSLQPIKILYAAEFWPPTHEGFDQLPSAEKIQRAALKMRIAGVQTVLDVEQWPLFGVSPDVGARNLNKLVSFADQMKSAAPGISIGYYGQLPRADYWRAIKGESSVYYAKWRQENDSITVLASHVDALYPSMYTAKRDSAEWARAAVENIKEAKRVSGGKPVYVFLWPFFDSNATTKREDVFRYIGDAYWRLQLETVYANADGVVIWGGWDFSKGRRAKWDESAPWWSVTKAFLSSHNIGR